MCGVLGVWDLAKSLDTSSCVAALDAIAHRGPDDFGIWENNNGVFLGHRRLSIIDLSPLGRQPMTLEDNKFAVSFNGEIYNYQELRKQLSSEGVEFRGSSDTEVILPLYQRYGLDFVNHLRGMFAIIIWDSQQRRFILCRDRFGKKPLYYSNSQERIVAGSEIKALLKLLPSSEQEIDHRALDSFLSFGAITGQSTIYKSIREVPPGSVLMFDSSHQVHKIDTQLSQYYKPTLGNYQEVTFEDAVNEVEKRLIDAVKVRLFADVPVGLFLSGGIDSGLIAGILSKHFPNHSVESLCIGLEDQHLDERTQARLVAKHCNLTHHEAELEIADVASVLPKILANYDEPFADPSCVPSYFVSKLARQYFPVVLNGDGGDELFCGYRRHLFAAQLDKVMRFAPSAIIRPLAKSILKVIPLSSQGRSSYTLFRRALEVCSTPKAEQILPLSSQGFLFSEKKLLYRDPKMAYPTESYFALDPKEDENLLEQVLRYDLEHSLPEALLVKMDIATMAHSLEARSPFLDQNLAAYALQLNPFLKLQGGSTKAILRELAKRYLPHEIVTAPKRGFEIPVKKWIEDDFRELLNDMLLTRNGLITDIFSRKVLEDILCSDSKFYPAHSVEQTCYGFYLPLVFGIRIESTKR